MKDISQRMMETSEDTNLGTTRAASIAANGSRQKKGEQMKERKKLYEKNGCNPVLVVRHCSEHLQRQCRF